MARTGRAGGSASCEARRSQRSRVTAGWLRGLRARAGSDGWVGGGPHPPSAHAPWALTYDAAMAETPPDTGFWALLGEQARALLMASGQERRVPARRRLFEEGRPAPSLVVILEGGVKVSTVAHNGEERLLAVRGAGDLLGEMAGLIGGSRTATVTAIDDVRAVVFAREEFERLWRKEPAILGALVRALVQRIEQADRARIELLDEAPVRVRRLLADLVARFSVPESGGGRRIDVSLTQEELASLAFTSRGVVATVLRELRERGLVHTGRRELVVTDPEALLRAVRPDDEAA
jgi:CRP/FNR family transcriptional regulator, cyclic AMP receptor protein